MGDPIINAQVDDINTTLGLIKTDLSALRPSIHRLKEAIAETYITDTIENVAIATIDDGADSIPVRELQVAIEPVQSGTGDPSPSNPRAISGHTEVNVTRTGKNFIKYVTQSRTTSQGITATVNNDGTVTINGTASASTTAVINFEYATSSTAEQNIGKKCIPNGSYIVSNGNIGGVKIQIIGSNNPTGTSDITTLFNDTAGNITIDDSYAYNWVRLSVASGTVCTDLIVYPMIRLATDSDATWEAYNGNTYPISLGQTVYGGTLNVTTGVLTITHKEVDMGDLSWSRGTLSGVYFFQTASITDRKVQLDAFEKPPICSVYKYWGNGTTTEIGQGCPNLQFATQTTQVAMRFRDDSYTDADTFKSAVTGQTLVYELATPTEVQLTAAEISTLYEDNNIWSDTGNIIKLVYRVDWAHYLAQE